MHNLLTFWEFLSTNINWLFFGLIFGLAIILVFSIFQKSFLKWWVCLIILILSVCASYGICALVKKNKDVKADYHMSNEQIAEELEKHDSENWGNANGGFTFEEIKKTKTDDDCPTLEDIVLNLSYKDFGDYVCFYFYDNDLGIYQNIVLLKTERGLIKDGMLNVTSTYDRDAYWASWLTFGICKKYDLSTFEWSFEKEKEPYYYTQTRKNFLGTKTGMGDYEDVILLSSESANFSRVPLSKGRMENWKEARSLALENAIVLVSDNSIKNFTKFDNVELIGASETATKSINSFYNYLYENIKDLNIGESKMVDASNLLCVPIAEEIKHNFPIPLEKKSEYNNADFYGVYNVSIAVNVNVTQANKFFNKSANADDYLDANKDSETTQVEKFDNVEESSLINLIFKNSQNSDLTYLDLTQNPVTITFSNKELNATKTVVISDKEKLNTSTNVLLAKGYEWTYEIASTGLIFDSYKGTFTNNNSVSNLTFEYYFLNNYIMAYVGLNPIKDIDASTIDLAQNPVKVILSNNKHTYQFVFDDNSKLNSRLSQIIELGSYDYSILSKQLIFASVTGKLTITTTENIMLFNYGLNIDVGALKFTVWHTTATHSTGPNILLSADSSVVDVIRGTLSSTKQYNVLIVVYGDDGKIVEQFSHNHLGSGVCSDSWISNNLVDNTHYTVQIRFADMHDTSVTYLSDFIDLTYDSTLNYTFHYSAILN